MDKLQGLQQKNMSVTTQAHAYMQAHKRVDFGQPLELWPRGSKKTGMLLLMAEKPSYTCSKCHKL